MTVPPPLKTLSPLQGRWEWEGTSRKSPWKFRGLVQLRWRLLSRCCRKTVDRASTQERATERGASRRLSGLCRWPVWPPCAKPSRTVPMASAARARRAPRATSRCSFLLQLCLCFRWVRGTAYCSIGPFISTTHNSQGVQLARLQVATYYSLMLASTPRYHHSALLTKHIMSLRVQHHVM